MTQRPKHSRSSDLRVRWFRIRLERLSASKHLETQIHLRVPLSSPQQPHQPPVHIVECMRCICDHRGSLASYCILCIPKLCGPMWLAYPGMQFRCRSRYPVLPKIAFSRPDLDGEELEQKKKKIINTSNQPELTRAADQDSFSGRRGNAASTASANESARLPQSFGTCSIHLCGPHEHHRGA